MSLSHLLKIHVGSLQLIGRAPNSKLDDEERAICCDLYMQGKSQTQVAKETGLSRCTVRGVLLREGIL